MRTWGGASSLPLLLSVLRSCLRRQLLNQLHRDPERQIVQDVNETYQQGKCVTGDRILLMLHLARIGIPCQLSLTGAYCSSARYPTLLADRAFHMNFRENTLKGCAQ